MKKKESNLAVTAGNGEYLNLEQRILRSDLSEQDKIELIKMIGRDRTSSWTYTTPVNPLTITPNYTPDYYYTTTTPETVPVQKTVITCCHCCEE